jgi:hypothetical protein
MSATAQQDHREKQARTAGEEARRRLQERAKERGRVFLDQLAGSEGADDKAERLDAEIAELERRVKIAATAAEEALKQAEEAAEKERQREIREARKEYDRMVGERVPLLERVEDSLDNLDAVLNEALDHDRLQSEVCTCAGLPSGGDFRGLLQGRVTNRLVAHILRHHISHPAYMEPITSTDLMARTVAELEEERADEQRKRDEAAEERRRRDEQIELDGRIKARRNELLKAHGAWNADTPPGKTAAVKPKIEEQLKREFPILQKKGS